MFMQLLSLPDVAHCVSRRIFSVDPDFDTVKDSDVSKVSRKLVYISVELV